MASRAVPAPPPRIGRGTGLGRRAAGGRLPAGQRRTGGSGNRAVASPVHDWHHLAVDAALDRFFAGRREARRIFRAVDHAVRAAGPATVRVTGSQMAFRRKRGFAWAWTPDRWLEGRTAPLVLSIALRRRDRSKRWKEVVRPAPGRWMHHLELWSPREVDEPVLAWLREAWELAG
jgi:hypothetical protein